MKTPCPWHWSNVKSPTYSSPDGNFNYRGINVGFMRLAENGDWLWKCKVQFTYIINGKIRGGGSGDYCSCYDSTVLSTYVFNQNPIYRDVAESETRRLGGDVFINIPNLIFRYSETNSGIERDVEVDTLMNSVVLMKWRVSEINNLRDVIKTVKTLRNTSGDFPKYNLGGYDYTYDALNCCGFAVKLLRSLGVKTNAYLDKYIDYRYDRGAGGWLQNYNLVTFIASAFDKSVGMHALTCGAVIDHLLQTNFSNRLSGNITRFAICPKAIVNNYKYDGLSSSTKQQLQSLANQNESEWRM